MPAGYNGHRHEQGNRENLPHYLSPWHETAGDPYEREQPGQAEEAAAGQTGAEWRKLRKDAGVSLRSLARTMGVSAAYLSDLERGRRNWSEEVESRYAGALRVERQVKGIQAAQGNLIGSL